MPVVRTVLTLNGYWAGFEDGRYLEQAVRLNDAVQDAWSEHDKVSAYQSTLFYSLRLGLTRISTEPSRIRRIWEGRSTPLSCSQRSRQALGKSSPFNSKLATVH